MSTGASPDASGEQKHNADVAPRLPTDNSPVEPVLDAELQDRDRRLLFTLKVACSRSFGERLVTHTEDCRLTTY